MRKNNNNNKHVVFEIFFIDFSCKTIQSGEESMTYTFDLFIK